MVSTVDNLGEKLQFSADETIYKQSSDSKGVYLLLQGEVEIWRHDDGEDTYIATIGEGELLGEVSVIEQRPHSVTAKAAKDTTALFIDAVSFQRSFSDPLVRHVVHTLAARLRSSYSVQGAKKAQVEETFNSNHLTIEGGSRLVASKLLTFVEIKEFPFAIGNIASQAKQSVITDTGLRVPLLGVPELVDSHFEIIRRDGNYHVRDLGSQQGTTVNGEHLSKYAMNATAKLHVGKNEIIAGKPDSPVRFKIMVPPGAFED